MKKSNITLPNGNTVAWTRANCNRDEPLTTKDIREAYDLYYVNGMRLIDVAKLFDNRSPSCMRYYFRQLGLPSKLKYRAKMTTARIKEAHKLYTKGEHSLAAIAKMYDDRTPHCMRYYFRLLELPIMDYRRPKPTKKCKHPKCSNMINTQNRKYCSNACSHDDRYMNKESVKSLKAEIKNLKEEVKYLKNIEAKYILLKGF